jgi:SAM-dependent methyltransferase
MPALVRAYQSGDGVPYADYAIHDIQGNFNKPIFINLLASEWLPSIPGLAERLSGPTARVAELGCGEGWAAIAIAQAWPQVTVDGYDLDEASIAAARQNAADAGVSDRVHFELADVADTAAFGAGGHDLVFAFEMVHDLARPVQALETMRRLGAPGATYLVVDERAEESFAAPSESPWERFFYVASVLHCLPAGRNEPDSAATGTVMRPAMLRGYADAAGFGSVEVLPIEHDMFRFYRLEES